jgi:para-aminobenzoate synthetase component I
MANKDTIIKKMNEWGKEKTPFLFMIDFEMLEPLVMPLNEVDPAKIIYYLNAKTNQPSTKNISKNFNFKISPTPYKRYLDKFNKVKNQIKIGNTYLLNLTCPTPVETNLTLLEIFEVSKARYKLLLQDQFVVFSPEIFVQIKEDQIYSYPMKGTIDASIENAEQLILQDEKEIAEHYTIVDLIRNDLNIVAKNVKVEKFRYLEKIRTNNKDLLQVSSKISGQLQPNWQSNIGNFLFELLPAGSVTGAPKKKTVEIILDVEKYKRGFYTGIFGIFDGETLDSSVMIRFIENTPTGLVFKSGGGITSLSDSVKEYSEMIDKIYLPLELQTVSR